MTDILHAHSVNDEAVRRVYNVKSDAAVLIRPDNHIVMTAPAGNYKQAVANHLLTLGH